MEPRSEPPPCHLLRLPYELLKPILAELSKQDQISAAKTCVILWELAYPMAYNRITVTIRPGLKDSAWQHLASGVGLRYVQHFTISSSCDDTEKGRRLKDLVIGTLIAALRRNQLLSFTSTPPALWKGIISTKHVVSLVETQRSLRKLSLPGLEGSSSIRLRDYFQPRQVFSGIHELTVNVSCDQNYDGEIYEIVKKSPNLLGLHICFSQDAADAVPQRYPKHLNASPNRHNLHSAVTHLTLQGAIFRTFYNDLSFPNLRALAIVDCERSGRFFTDLDSEEFPRLSAIMIKTHSTVSPVRLREFIRGLKSLRELIVHGEHVWFNDGSDIVQCGKTLQLLSLHDSQARSCFFLVEAAAEDFLKALPALRHLSFFLSHVFKDYSGSHSGDGYTNYCSILDILASYSNLQTLGLRCSLYLKQTPWAHEDQHVAQVDQGAFCEESLGRHAITKVNAADKLEYLSVKATCRVYPGAIKHDSTFHLKDSKSFKKHMFSLKPKLTFGEASEMKKQMLDRYSGDGYYFLEDYIDGMMIKSEVYLTNRS